jgi:hypothetical protein
MICVQVVVFPQESAAWYVRVMIRGQLPLHTSLTQVTTGVPQLSLAVTNVISGDGTSVTHATVTADGHRICGAMLSFTVISCAHVAVFPQLSVAWYVRVMIRGQRPDHVSPVHVTSGTPQLSVALTDVMSTAGTALRHATVTAAGQVICGAMLSLTVMSCTHVEVFPQLSAAM